MDDKTYIALLEQLVRLAAASQQSLVVDAMKRHDTHGVKGDYPGELIAGIKVLELLEMV